MTSIRRFVVVLSLSWLVVRAVLLVCVVVLLLLGVVWSWRIVIIIIVTTIMGCIWRCVTCFIMNVVIRIIVQDQAASQRGRVCHDTTVTPVVEYEYEQQIRTRTRIRIRTNTVKRYEYETRRVTKRLALVFLMFSIPLLRRWIFLNREWIAFGAPPEKMTLGQIGFPSTKSWESCFYQRLTVEESCGITHSKTRHSTTTWCDAMPRHHMVWHDMVWHELVWHAMIWEVPWYDMIW